MLLAEELVRCIDERGGLISSISVYADQDAATWIVRAVEAQTTGTFNVTGPGERLSMGEFLETCCRVLNRQARLTWVAEDFLVEYRVAPWTELPLWLPVDANGFLAIDGRKAQETGLAFRPLDATIVDTFQWTTQGKPVLPERLESGASTGAGLEPGREAFLLRRWHSREVVSSA